MSIYSFMRAVVCLVLTMTTVSAGHCEVTTSAATGKVRANVDITTIHDCAKNVTIPIIYLTDRNLAGNTFGGDRRYPTHCRHHMYYGTAFVSVPNEARKSASALSQSLGWTFDDHRGAKISEKQMIDPENSDVAKATFYSRLEGALDASKSSELCLYVHGSADAFEDCLGDAARQAYQLEKPVVLYSWPSHSRYRGYFIDSGNCEWSQGHFVNFCRELAAVRARRPLDVTVVTHSMGGRLVARALPVLDETRLISDYELVSPDIDADTFTHYLYGHREERKKIRIYVSNKDKLLPLVQLLSGGYFRLGEGANPTFPSPRTPQALSFERVDFTAVDPGLEGHGIPFDLIASMQKTGKPPEGMAMVPERVIRPSGFVRFIGRSAKFHVEDIEPEGNCSFRIIRTK